MRGIACGNFHWAHSGTKGKIGATMHTDIRLPLRIFFGLVSCLNGENHTGPSIGAAVDLREGIPCHLTCLLA